MSENCVNIATHFPFVPSRISCDVIEFYQLIFNSASRLHPMLPSNKLTPLTQACIGQRLYHQFPLFLSNDKRPVINVCHLFSLVKWPNFIFTIKNIHKRRFL